MKILKSIGNNELSTSIFKGSKEPFRGWHCPYYDQIVAAPEVSIKQEGSGEIVFNTLLLPIKGVVNEIPQYKLIDGIHEVIFDGIIYKVTIGKKGKCTIERQVV